MFQILTYASLQEGNSVISATSFLINNECVVSNLYLQNLQALETLYITDEIPVHFLTSGNGRKSSYKG